MNMSYPSDLTDGEWEALQPYLPVVPRHGQPRTHPLRSILNEVFYLLRTGCPWRYLPRTFPPRFPRSPKVRLNLTRNFRFKVANAAPEVAPNLDVRPTQ